MRTLNRVTIRGHLGRDPKIYLNPDTTVARAKLSVATNGFNRETGEQLAPQWHFVTLFGQLAQFAQQEVRKGMRIQIVGRLQYSTYTDANGLEKFGAEIIANDLVILQAPRNQPAQQPEQQQQTQQPSQQPSQQPVQPQADPNLTKTLAAIRALMVANPALRQALNKPNGEADLEF